MKRWLGVVGCPGWRCPGAGGIAEKLIQYRGKPVGLCVLKGIDEQRLLGDGIVVEFLEEAHGQRHGGGGAGDDDIVGAVIGDGVDFKIGAAGLLLAAGAAHHLLEEAAWAAAAGSTAAPSASATATASAATPAAGGLLLGCKDRIDQLGGAGRVGVFELNDSQIRQLGVAGVELGDNLHDADEPRADVSVITSMLLLALAVMSASVPTRINRSCLSLVTSRWATGMIQVTRSSVSGISSGLMPCFTGMALCLASSMLMILSVRPCTTAVMCDSRRAVFRN